MKENSNGLTHIYHSTLNSLKGLRTAIKNEAAFRQELVLVLILFALSFALCDTFIEWCILVFPLFTLLITELLNSSIESTVDRIGKEYHVLSGAAKDLGSAAVFVNLLFIAIIWVVFLLRSFGVLWASDLPNV